MPGCSRCVKPCEGTIGELIRTVNRLWKFPAVLERPLSEFARVLPEPERHLESARALNRQYGQMVGEALKMDDDGESLNRVFAWLKRWQEVHAGDADEWVRAAWHAVHTKASGGKGSLAFHLFPERLAQMIAEAETSLPDKVAIVGLQYNAYRDHLEQFDGRERVVTFKLAPLSDRLRLAAYVDGKMLGVVSSETPVPEQNTYHLRLTRSTRGKGQVVYALPAV